MAFLSILFLGMGILLLVLALKGYATSKKALKACGIYATLLGATMLVLSVLHLDKAFVCVFCIGLGVIFIATAVWTMVKPFVCTEKTVGIYIGAQHHGQGWYTPCFQYYINDRQFQGKSGNVYREWTLKRKYEVGRNYTIWYDLKNPYMFVERRKIKLINIGILLVGIMFCMLCRMVIS